MRNKRVLAELERIDPSHPFTQKQSLITAQSWLGVTLQENKSDAFYQAAGRKL